MKNIHSIYNEISTCNRCRLGKKNNTRIIMKNGNFNSKILFVTGPPNLEESKYGETLKGKSGYYFLKILNNYGIKKEDIWCENIMHCRTFSKRPKEDELDICSEYIFNIISTIRPIVIVSMGSIATNVILMNWLQASIKIIRGRFKSQIFGFDDDLKKLNQINIMPTWSPSYALKNRGKIEQEFKDDILKACIRANIRRKVS